MDVPNTVLPFQNYQSILSNCWILTMHKTHNKIHTRWFKPWPFKIPDRWRGHKTLEFGARFHHPKRVTSRIARYVFIPYINSHKYQMTKCLFEIPLVRSPTQVVSPRAHWRQYLRKTKVPFAIDDFSWMPSLPPVLLHRTDYCIRLKGKIHCPIHHKLQNIILHFECICHLSKFCKNSTKNATSFAWRKSSKSLPNNFTNENYMCVICWTTKVLNTKK